MISLAQNTNTVFTKIIYHRRQMGKDLTGKLPLTSNRGNKYLFMIYDYNINMILIQPMKEISDRKFIRVFKDLHEHLLTRGIKPSCMKMDN